MLPDAECRMPYDKLICKFSLCTFCAAVPRNPWESEAVVVNSDDEMRVCLSMSVCLTFQSRNYRSRSKYYAVLFAK